MPRCSEQEKSGIHIFPTGVRNEQQEMFGETTRSPISSAGTPHVTDAFPQSHAQNSPPDSRTVLLHFHCNPVLVAVVVCSSTAQTVFNTQKKKVYLQAPALLHGSISPDQARTKDICKTNTFSAQSVTVVLCLLFSLLMNLCKKTLYNSLVSCLMGDQVHLWTHPYSKFSR